MKRNVLLVVAAALFAGCSHAHSVGPAEEKTEAPQKRAEPQPQEELSSPTTPSSPTALLKPGGAKAIQDKLMGTGELNGAPTGRLDGPTRSALARFQKAHDLPATGLPDDATVAKLGLKADDVFRPTGVGEEKP